MNYSKVIENKIQENMAEPSQKNKESIVRYMIRRQTPEENTECKLSAPRRKRLHLPHAEVVSQIYLLQQLVANLHHA